MSKKYEELEEQAIRDLVEGPTKTFIKIWRKEKIYRTAFRNVLKEKGVVTREDLEEELKRLEMKKKRVYISGPISGHDIADRKWAFMCTKLQLEEQGYEVYNPMENGLPAEASTTQHMRRDLSELTREDKPYDAIYLMKGWNHSAGCWTEFKVALAIGLEVLAEQDDAVYRFV